MFHATHTSQPPANLTQTANHALLRAYERWEQERPNDPLEWTAVTIGGIAMTAIRHYKAPTPFKELLELFNHNFKNVVSVLSSSLNLSLIVYLDQEGEAGQRQPSTEMHSGCTGSLQGRPLPPPSARRHQPPTVEQRHFCSPGVHFGLQGFLSKFRRLGCRFRVQNLARIGWPTVDLVR